MEVLIIFVFFFVVFYLRNSDKTKNGYTQDNFDTQAFPATIEIKGIDEIGILGKIIQVISDEYAVNVSKVSIETFDGIFEGRITVYVHDVDDVTNLCMNIMKINGINSVMRVENDK